MNKPENKSYMNDCFLPSNHMETKFQVKGTVTVQNFNYSSQQAVINSPINMKVKCLEEATQILRNEIKMFQLKPGVRYQKTRVFDRYVRVEQCTQGTKVPRSKASTKNSGYISLL